MASPDVYGNRPSMGGAPRANVPAFMGWMGAISSVALMVGLGYWVYDLATRDARSVPVVRALEGPSRLAPEDPGGFEAAHKGYAVNSIASEKGKDTPLSDRVTLAPDPVGPEETDKPVAAAKVTPPDPASALRSAVEGALSEVLGLPGPDASEDGAAAPVPGAEPDAAGTENDNGADAGTVIRPMPRPGSAGAAVVTRASATAAAATLGVTSAEVDPSGIGAGSRLVQLGAFDSRDEADAVWSSLSASYYDYFALHPKVIEEASVNGRTFYRLRAFGFDDLAAAQNFCAMLVAAQVDCIPVLTQ